jgi:hypothetical protein
VPNSEGSSYVVLHNDSKFFFDRGHHYYAFKAWVCDPKKQLLGRHSLEIKTRDKLDDSMRPYRTAWTWMHKLLRAMVRPGRDNLSDLVEVDETFIGGQKPGKRGRGAAGKVLVGIAVADKEAEGIGATLVKCIPQLSYFAYFTPRLVYLFLIIALPRARTHPSFVFSNPSVLLLLRFQLDAVRVLNLL